MKLSSFGSFVVRNEGPRIGEQTPTNALYCPVLKTAVALFLNRRLCATINPQPGGISPCSEKAYLELSRLRCCRWPMLCKTLGRPKNDDAKQRAAVVRLRKQGIGILKIARTVGAGTSYVQRIVAEIEAAAS